MVQDHVQLPCLLIGCNPSFKCCAQDNRTRCINAAVYRGVFFSALGRHASPLEEGPLVYLVDFLRAPMLVQVCRVALFSLDFPPHIFWDFSLPSRGFA